MILGTYLVTVEGGRLTLTSDEAKYSIPIAGWQLPGFREIYQSAMDQAKANTRRGGEDESVQRGD